MKKANFVTAQEAVKLIEDGSTICTIGMTLISASETILKEIERAFLEEGHPKNLTLLHTCGQAAMKQPFGIQHLAHEGLLRRIIGGHWGQSNKIMDLISGNRIEAFNLPQGQMANMFHSMALREPGKLSKVGLGTYIDPRIEGGKMNQRTKDCGYDMVDLVTVDQEEYIRYKPVPIDTLIIRGTTADEFGNITTDEEAMVLELWPAVMATKRYGGKVICQVKYTAKGGSLNPKAVTIPGVFVDAVVVCPNPEEEHRQTYSWYFDPSYSGQAKAPESASEPAPGGIRKFIARRALMELTPYQNINIGTGIPNDVIGPIIAEEDVADQVMITVESGVYGGVPAETIDFGISRNAVALVQHDRQFEFYNGMGIDFTFMGAGEMDAEGNINATRMGDKAPGAGGFIDITATARNVIFCSTFTGGGLKVDFDENGVHIQNEGKFKKLVNRVQQVSYCGKIAHANGQRMFYVTERAVFEMTADGPVLVEIAKGVDLQRDVLDQMEFTPRIAEHLKETPTWLYKDGRYGLKDLLHSKEETV